MSNEHNRKSTNKSQTEDNKLDQRTIITVPNNENKGYIPTLHQFFSNSRFIFGKNNGIICKSSFCRF